MNEARLIGTIETDPERWFVNGEALVRCYVRAPLPEIDYFPSIFKPSVVVEVLARGSAATQLWSARPGERVWVSGRLSFIDSGAAIGPQVSSLLVDTTRAGYCLPTGSEEGLALLTLTGTVRDPATDPQPHELRRSIFLLANRMSLSSPFPRPDSHAICTVLGLKLRDQTGGLELGERVTLLGHLVTADDTIDENGGTKLQFLATDLLAEEVQLDESLVLQPGSIAVRMPASNLVH